MGGVGEEGEWTVSLARLFFAILLHLFRWGGCLSECEGYLVELHLIICSPAHMSRPTVVRFEAASECGSSRSAEVYSVYRTTTEMTEGDSIYFRLITIPAPCHDVFPLILLTLNHTNPLIANRLF